MSSFRDKKERITKAENRLCQQQKELEELEKRLKKLEDLDDPFKPNELGMPNGVVIMELEQQIKNLKKQMRRF